MHRDHSYNPRLALGLALTVVGALFTVVSTGPVTGPITLGVVGVTLIVTSRRGPKFL